MRFTPQHIHLDIEVAGYSKQASLLVLDDDPSVNADWHKWAGRLGNLILELAERTGTLYGTVEIVLDPD